MGMERERRKYPKGNGNLASAHQQTQCGPKGLQMGLIRTIRYLIIILQLSMIGNGGKRSKYSTTFKTAQGCCPCIKNFAPPV